MLQPYQQYLTSKTEKVDLHAIKEQVYDKIGTFDYGRFEGDICEIMNEVKSSMGDFKIICKQYEIEVPTIKIDQKELKGLDLKFPSILD